MTQTEPAHTPSQLVHGDKVKCLAGTIDKNMGRGEIGYITGFARLSSYHGREVFVSDKMAGHSSAPWCGWFWISDVEKIASDAALLASKGGC